MQRNVAIFDGAALAAGDFPQCITHCQHSQRGSRAPLGQPLAIGTWLLHLHTTAAVVSLPFSVSKWPGGEPARMISVVSVCAECVPAAALPASGEAGLPGNRSAALREEQSSQPAAVGSPKLTVGTSKLNHGGNTQLEIRPENS